MHVIFTCIMVLGGLSLDMIYDGILWYRLIYVVDSTYWEKAFVVVVVVH